VGPRNVEKLMSKLTSGEAAATPAAMQEFSGNVEELVR